MADEPQNTQSRAKPDPATAGLGQVLLRNAFYRDGYRALLSIALVQGVALLLLVVALATVALTKKTQDIYFATTQDGRLIRMMPLNEPNLSDAALLSWAAQAASEALTFGHNDYRRRLQEAQRHFTKAGWDSFTKGLEASDLIPRLEANNQVLTTVPSQAPMIESQGPMNGMYTWVVQIPVVLTYQSGNIRDPHRYTLRVVIVRVPELESPYGVGIQKFVYDP
ncbi:MAG TPA: type IV secretion protein IcmL [Rhodospirillaceae bacterium]|nr:type IVB secretion system apparatus protein IcmL/DotI [Alphaproteobacteria bacterium]HBH25894.1 type IV secretion protein IcmL [Rhodospirillaceae bacterium]